MYSNKVCEISENSINDNVEVGVSYLKGKGLIRLVILQEIMSLKYLT
mgnify:CR=1 FL=1